MNILLLSPFHGESHAMWTDQLIQVSHHCFLLLDLKPRHWKWKMHGGSIQLAEKFLASSFKPDLILATDMLDLTIFLALTKSRTFNIPTVIYFHENQFSYPKSDMDSDSVHKRDDHYGFINYVSALAADAVVFNSRFHQSSFFSELGLFLASKPDNQGKTQIMKIRKKSSVLPVGVNLDKIASMDKSGKTENEPPLILWNHRWEHDKNPEDFFKCLFDLKKNGIPFRLACLGKHYRRVPAVFDEVRQVLKAEIIHWGYVESRQTYLKWLKSSDILPVTSHHDFFGISTVEAMAAGVFPLLPNRLVYPEHIPEKCSDQCLYQSNKELYKKLTEILTHGFSDISSELRQHLRKYDLQYVIPQYDQMFEGLVSSK